MLDDRPRLRTRGVRYAGGGVLFLAALVAGFGLGVGWAAWQQARSSRPRFAPCPSPQVVFHSTLPFHEVHVPFRERDGWLLVSASFSGRPLSCLVDTGSSQAAMWPAHLRLPVRTGQEPSEPDGRWAVVKSIRLGDYEVRDVPATVARQPDDSAAIPKRRTSPAAARAPILGNPLFASTVVTFDYRRRLLIIRSADYDPARRRPSGRRICVPMVRIGCKDDRTGRCLPGIRGRLAGQKVVYVLDTGTDGAAVTSWFAERHCRGYKRRPGVATRAFGRREPGQVVCGLPGEAAGHRLLLECSVLPDRLEAEGVLGRQFLRRFRVTLDYPRGRVVLEPR